MSKRVSKAGRSKGSRNQLPANDRELIAKALNLAVKTLGKRKDNLSDKDMLLFMTKLGPYCWAEDIVANNSSDNNNSGATTMPGADSSGTAKPKAKNSRAKGAKKQFSTDEQETITKAMRLIVNTLCKRIDRLSNKDLILFLALMARYKQTPDAGSGEEEIREVTVGVGA